MHFFLVGTYVLVYFFFVSELTYAYAYLGEKCCLLYLVWEFTFVRVTYPHTYCIVFFIRTCLENNQNITALDYSLVSTMHACICDRKLSVMTTIIT